MKVMIVSPYIYEENMVEFTRNKTGFGIMVRNIVDSVGELNDVVLLTRVITNEKKEKNYKILSHTWKQIFLSAKIKDWLVAIISFFENKATLKDRVRRVFYEMDGGYFRKQIQMEKPDIIHIHGLGTISKSYIRICEEMKIKYVVTLHGLIGLNDSISAPEYEKKIERDFLMSAENHNIPVSVISSGMKNRIEKKYLGKKASNITIITNGTKRIESTDVNLNDENNALREEVFLEYYNDCLKQNSLYPKISDTYSYLIRSKKNSKKILFFVGNITQNKNQIQAVEVLRNKKIFADTILVFWGREVDGGKVRNKIREYKLQKNVILGGFNERMSEFWNLCDVNVFLSLNDGFGLSIVEGYMRGIPCVTFEDLDATEDLYFPESMIKITERSTESVTNALQTALDKKWNHEKIIEVGNKFSIDMMAQKYSNWYKKVIM